MQFQSVKLCQFSFFDENLTLKKRFHTFAYKKLYTNILLISLQLVNYHEKKKKFNKINKYKILL